MAFIKKIDRAVQWAGEKMGSESKTSHSEEFQRLEAEMGTRQEGTLVHDTMSLILLQEAELPLTGN